jgi:hypothetical protein
MALLGIYLMGCVLLAAAGAAKAARPADTARALAMSVSRPPTRRWVHAVRILAGAEAVIGVVGIVRPDPVVAGVVAASYLAFTAFVLFAMAKGGALSTCGCFGSPDTPPTISHAAINFLVAVASVVVAATVADGWLGTVARHQYLRGVPLFVAVLVAAWLAFLVMSPLARLQALRRMEPYLPNGHAGGQA